MFTCSEQLFIEVVVDTAQALPAFFAPVAADLGLKRPLVAAGRVAAKEGGAAELVLRLPAEHAPRFVAFAAAVDRRGQAVLMVDCDAAVGRALARRECCKGGFNC